MVVFVNQVHPVKGDVVNALLGGVKHIHVVELLVKGYDDLKGLDAQVAVVNRLCGDILVLVKLFFLGLLIFKLVLDGLDLSHHPLLSFDEVILVLLNLVVSSRDDLLQVEMFILDQGGQASVNFLKLNVNTCELFDLVLHWLDLDDILLALKDLLQVNEPDEIIDQAHSLKQSILLGTFLNLRKCFSHNCDKHVHKNNRDDKSGKEKHWDGKLGSISILVSGWIEGSKSTHQVDVQDGI